MYHLLGYAASAARTCAILALLIAVLAPLEHFFAVRRARFFYPGWATNLGWYFVNSVASVFILGPPTAVIAWGIHAVVPAAITGTAAALPLGIKMIAAMVVGEVGFYWGHRLSHQWPILWRFHAIHHSAEHMNFLVNMRAHPIDLVFTRVCGLVLLYASGLTGVVGPHPTLVPALVLFIGSMWSFLIHANVRWRFGPMEEIISSPAFHHWHHTRNDHIDRNFSSMVPFIDRVFGTFYLPKHWPAEYGIDAPMPSSLTGQLLEPFAPPRRAPDAHIAPAKASMNIEADA